jgi:hypothetical protein
MTDLVPASEAALVQLQQTSERARVQAGVELALPHLA